MVVNLTTTEKELLIKLAERVKDPTVDLAGSTEVTLVALPMDKDLAQAVLDIVESVDPATPEGYRLRVERTRLFTHALNIGLTTLFAAARKIAETEDKQTDTRLGIDLSQFGLSLN